MSINWLLGAQAFGGAMSTVGAYYSARGEKMALQGKADIADINARLSELSAKSAILSGQREEQKVRLNTSQLKARQRTGMAANGIALDSDSAVSILTTTDVMGEIDANTVASNAAREAWGYRTQAVSMQNEARSNRAGAKNISPFASAFGTLLTSASSMASNYYTLKKEGAFSEGAPPPTSTSLPWQSTGNVRPKWMGGGRY